MPENRRISPTVRHGNQPLIRIGCQVCRCSFGPSSWASWDLRPAGFLAVVFDARIVDRRDRGRQKIAAAAPPAERRGQLKAPSSGTLRYAPCPWIKEPGVEALLRATRVASSGRKIHDSKEFCDDAPSLVDGGATVDSLVRAAAGVREETRAGQSCCRSGYTSWSHEALLAFPLAPRHPPLSQILRTARVTS